MMMIADNRIVSDIRLFLVLVLLSTSSIITNPVVVVEGNGIWNKLIPHVPICQRIIDTTNTTTNNSNIISYKTILAVNPYQAYLRVFIQQSAYYGSCRNRNVCKYACNQGLTSKSTPCTPSNVVAFATTDNNYTCSCNIQLATPLCSTNNTTKTSYFCNTTSNTCQCYYGFSFNTNKTYNSITEQQCTMDLLNTTFPSRNSAKQWIETNLWSDVYERYIQYTKYTPYYSTRAYNRSIDRFTNFYYYSDIRESTKLQTPTFFYYFLKLNNMTNTTFRRLKQIQGEEPINSRELESDPSMIDSTRLSTVHLKIVQQVRDQIEQYSSSLPKTNRQLGTRSVVFSDLCLDMAYNVSIESIYMALTSEAFGIPRDLTLPFINQLITTSSSITPERFRILFGLTLVKYNGLSNEFFIGIVIVFLSSFNWEEFHDAFAVASVSIVSSIEALLQIVNDFILQIFATVTTNGWSLYAPIASIRTKYLELYEQNRYMIGECFSDVPSIPCSEFQSIMGGQNYSSFIIDMGRRYGNFTVSYDMYDTPDDIEVWYQNQRIYWPGGYVSGNTTVDNLSFNGTSQMITVRVRAPFDGSTWIVSVSCPY